MTEGLEFLIKDLGFSRTASKICGLKLMVSGAANTLLEIPALRQSGRGSFCLDLSCFVLCGDGKE
jgi:hypothetical protein